MLVWTRNEQRIYEGYVVAMENYRVKIKEIIDEVGQVIKGKNEVIETALTAILAEGHILLEDIPGVGKTSLAVAFSKAMELSERRIQFTPDVLPSDVVGFNIMNKDGEFEYKAGSVMCNLLVADEINRTSSKTQSALLEVMEEGSVTIDGVTRKLEKPFIVIATQNPVGSIGTQNLPESQLDRFMVRLSMGYPDVYDEINLLRDRQGQSPLMQVKKVISKEELLNMQNEVKEVFVHDKVLEYTVALVNITRDHPMITLGISPRGTLALVDMAKARAYMLERDYCLPEDVKYVFQSVGAHRLMLSSNAKVNHLEAAEILEEISKKVAMPTLKRL